jgi:Fe-S-cluster-containing hydrogenase component 2
MKTRGYCFGCDSWQDLEERELDHPAGCKWTVWVCPCGFISFVHREVKLLWRPTKSETHEATWLGRETEADRLASDLRKEAEAIANAEKRQPGEPLAAYRKRSAEALQGRLDELHIMLDRAKKEVFRGNEAGRQVVEH